MFDLASFSLRDMTECGAVLRKLDREANTLQQVADQTVRFLYEQFCDRVTGAKHCALVRLFKTQLLSELAPNLQEYARRLAGPASVGTTTKCLTLLATAGDEPDWNCRDRSVGHRAIPLPSDNLVARLPMIAQLLAQFGVAPGAVLEPDRRLLLDLEQRSYNVFHVPDAVGSPYVPDQQLFVVRYGIRSVLGFGGILPTADLFAVILFAKVPIQRQTAEMFKPLALSVKMALLAFTGDSAPA